MNDDDDHSHLDPMTLRVHALESVLTATGSIDPAALYLLVDTYQRYPHRGFGQRRL